MADTCTFVYVYVCADIPLSVGILDPRASPTQLNAVEFLWEPSKRASAFIQVGGGAVVLWGSQESRGPRVVPQNSPPAGPCWAPVLFCRDIPRRGGGAGVLPVHRASWSLGLGKDLACCRILGGVCLSIYKLATK